MSRIYRVRDVQRSVYLLLLCPLIPLLLQLLHPSWALAVFGGVGAFLALSAMMLFQQRELEVAADFIRIDSGRRAQILDHADIYEIDLNKGNAVELRLEGRRRRVRVAPEDGEAAAAALAAFANRHMIPFNDRRGRRLTE
jgi:ferric-dicitrate binding protein FerR (iron transport regulator)